MLHSRLVAVELAVGLVANMTTANHLMLNLVIPAIFHLPIQTAIQVSARALADQKAPTPRFLAVAVAGLVSDSVELVAKQ